MAWPPDIPTKVNVKSLNKLYNWTEQSILYMMLWWWWWWLSSWWFKLMFYQLKILKINDIVNYYHMNPLIKGPKSGKLKRKLLDCCFQYLTLHCIALHCIALLLSNEFSCYFFLFCHFIAFPLHCFHSFSMESSMLIDSSIICLFSQWILTIKTKESLHRWSSHWF